MTLYLGADQAEWNVLMDEAEDLMNELEKGQHIIGVFPCGDRVYGFENARLGITALTIDSPHKLLDPGISHFCSRSQYSIGRNGYVTYLDLFDWAVQLLGQGASENHYLFGDNLYEDISISTILDLAREFSSLNREYFIPYFQRSSGTVHLLRHHLSFYAYDIYIPNLNKNWGEVGENLPWLSKEDCPPSIKEIDQELIQSISTNKPMPSAHKEIYYQYLMENLVKAQDKMDEKKKEIVASCFRSEIQKLYSSLM